MTLSCAFKKKIPRGRAPFTNICKHIYNLCVPLRMWYNLYLTWYVDKIRVWAPVQIRNDITYQEVHPTMTLGSTTNLPQGWSTAGPQGFRQCDSHETLRKCLVWIRGLAAWLPDGSKEPYRFQPFGKKILRWVVQTLRIIRFAAVQMDTSYWSICNFIMILQFNICACSRKSEVLANMGSSMNRESLPQKKKNRT